MCTNLRFFCWLTAAAALAAATGSAAGREGTPGSVESATVVGGYIDHELFWTDSEKSFDQHRFIPSVYGEVSDRIHVAAEIEFEHGGLVGGSGETDGEIKLEFATIDIEFSETTHLSRRRHSVAARACSTSSTTARCTISPTGH